MHFRLPCQGWANYTFRKEKTMHRALRLLTIWLLVASCKESTKPAEKSDGHPGLSVVQATDPITEKERTKTEPKPRAAPDNASFKKYRDAVMKLKSMHEKKPFVSMEATLEEFFRIVGKNGDDLELAGGVSTMGKWDNTYHIKIGEEVFTLLMAGRYDGPERNIQKCELIQFNVGQLEDSPFAFETLWEWHAPLNIQNQADEEAE
jgi:hypothetical protein